MGTEVSVLRAGQLIQSDPPRKLYHAPKTAFVARFVGETNLVAGTYSGLSGGKHIVNTAIGVIEAQRSMIDAAAGTKVMVSFRPEAVKLKLSTSDIVTSNKLDLRLEHLTYLGESEQFQLIGAEQTLIRANVFNPPDHSLQGGDTVTAWMAPEDVLVLPIETNQPAGT